MPSLRPRYMPKPMPQPLQAVFTRCRALRSCFLHGFSLKSLAGRAWTATVFVVLLAPLGLFGLAGCAPMRVPLVPPPLAMQAAPDALARSTLAPTGRLRVGVYLGSPTSLVRNAASGQSAGLALELGQAMATQLGVPAQVVEYSRVAQVIAALQAGELDMTFTNATAARSALVDFGQPLVRLELGYLVPANSPITSVAEVDRSGVRIGVSEGSSSSANMPKLLRAATVVTAASLAQAQTMLREQRLDAFATNKGVLYELADTLPGSRILAGRWGLEQLAIAVPKGRQAAAPWLQQFAQVLQSSGQLQAMVVHAGLRGSATDDTAAH